MTIRLAVRAVGHPERPESGADEVERRDEHDCDRLGEHLVHSEGDQRGEDAEVGDVGDQRDDEEAQTLEAHVAALVAERPDPVPEVVVRDGDQERDRGGVRVVPARAAQQRRVDREVDDVAARADGGELGELHPVPGMAERATRPGPHAEHGGLSRLHRPARLSAGAGSALDGAVLADDEVTPVADELAQCRRLVAVEVDLGEVEKQEGRIDLDRVVLESHRDERQEAVGLVAAEDVEPDCTRPLAVDEQVDWPAQLDAAHPHGKLEKILSLFHAALLCRSVTEQTAYSPKPSAPTSGTNRQGTEWISAGPSGLRTATSRRCPRGLPTGTTSRPRGFNCSYSVSGKPGAAAATAIPSNGACSGRPSVPSPTCTWTRSYPASASRSRARSANSGIRSIVYTSAASSASTAA